MDNEPKATLSLSAALAHAPRTCPDATCVAGDDARIGLVLCAQRPVQIAALEPADRTAVRFFWRCGACDRCWGEPARPLVDLFVDTLRRVAPERTVQAGGTEAIPLRGLATLVSCVPEGV